MVHSEQESTLKLQNMQFRLEAAEQLALQAKVNNSKAEMGTDFKIQVMQEQFWNLQQNMADFMSLVQSHLTKPTSALPGPPPKSLRPRSSSPTPLVHKLKATVTNPVPKPEITIQPNIPGYTVPPTPLVPPKIPSVKSMNTAPVPPPLERTAYLSEISECGEDDKDDSLAGGN